jgi:hypothetical protein
MARSRAGLDELAPRALGTKLSTAKEPTPRMAHMPATQTHLPRLANAVAAGAEVIDAEPGRLAGSKGGGHG